MTNLQSMDNTRDVTKYCEKDVDQKVGIATTLEEDTDWWQKDGEDDFADVAMNKRVNNGSLLCAKPRQNRCFFFCDGEDNGGAPASPFRHNKELHT